MVMDEDYCSFLLHGGIFFLPMFEIFLSLKPDFLENEHLKLGLQKLKPDFQC